MSQLQRYFSQIKTGLRCFFGYPVSELSDQINDNYWQKKLGKNIGSLSFFRLERAKIVSSFLENNASIVDLGAGDGAILQYLLQEKNLKAIAVDSSPSMIERLSGLSFEVKNYDLNSISNIELLPKADYYLALEVIEHLVLPEQLLKVISNKAKKEIIISIPNSGFFIHRLRLMFGRFPMQWINHPSEHLRFWTVADFNWWLKAQKINNYKIYFYQGVPVLNKLWPSLFAEGIIARICLEK